MKVFISQPMHGLNIETIQNRRNKCIEKIKSLYPNEKIDVVNDIVREDAPKDAGRLWFLGRAIQDLEKAEAIYFDKDWRSTKGCIIELIISLKYDLNILNINSLLVDINNTPQISEDLLDKYSQIINVPKELLR